MEKLADFLYSLLIKTIKSDTLAVIIFILVIFAIYYTGYNAAVNKIEQKQSTVLIEKQEDNDNSNMPYIPEFGPGSGTAIYPDRGILIIKFPDNVKMIVEQEGCQ